MTKKRLAHPRKGFYRFMIGCFHCFFAIFYKCQSYGREHIIEGGAIIAANHTSFFDPPLISVSMPEAAHYLAKESLFSVPVVGWIIRRLNAHPIRGSVRDLGIFRTIARLIKEGKKVVLFPEGTRAINDRISPLKRGVALMISRSKAPVIPTFIIGAHKVWGRKQKWPKLSGELTCIFGSPIYWESFAHLPEREAQEALLEAITAAYHALRDWYEAGAKGSPP